MSDAPVQVSYTFLYQSYFDGSYFEAAVLAQGAGGLIVDTASTPAQNADVSGYGVALEPSSETPIAISFRRAGQNSAAQLLRPGQVLFPFGRQKEDMFEGFKWGIPAGWLGGGRASVQVLRSPRAEMTWFGRPQIIFQRQTMNIRAKNFDLSSLASLVPNWPTRFPSFGTRRPSSTTAVAQSGSPILTVEPSLVLMRLKTALGTPLTQPSTIRFLFYECKEFDLDSAGAVVASIPAHEDITFPTGTSVGLAPTTMTAVEHTAEGPLVSLGIDPSIAGLTGIGVLPIDLGDGDALDSAILQVVRYGRL